MLQFGSSRMEEGDSRRRTAWWHGWRGGGADGSQRWELMEAGGQSRWRDENGLRAKEAAA
jgi:chitinase